MNHYVHYLGSCLFTRTKTTRRKIRLNIRIGIRNANKKKRIVVVSNKNNNKKYKKKEIFQS